MNLNLQIDTKEFERALKRLGDQMEDLVVDAAKAGGKVVELAADAKAPGPHIVSEVTDQGPGFAEVSIGPNKEHWYYKFFEFGASSHQIKAKDAALLAFEGRRGPVLTPAVSHPGMAAKPFLRPAIKTERSAAVSAAGDTFKRGIRS